MAASAIPWPAARSTKILAAALLAIVAAGPATRQALGILHSPRQHLYLDDALTFLGSGPAAGFGIREAADYLLDQARQGPLTVFTDPIWGPPADSMFIYLNQRSGIRVYEAWWTTISPHYPILPPAPIEFVKSQYQRVAAGVLNPATLGPTYYVTETFYNPPAAVHARQPAAERVASFPKPNGRDSIDIYRLR